MDWLIVTNAQLATINALLPAKIRVRSVVTVGGQKAIGADLLTDCGPGQTYEPAAEVLSSLPVVTGDPDTDL